MIVNSPGGLKSALYIKNGLQDGVIKASHCAAGLSIIEVRYSRIKFLSIRFGRFNHQVNALTSSGVANVLIASSAKSLSSSIFC